MKIDVLPIIRDHFGTLRDARTEKYSVVDFALFYGLPLVSASVPFVWRIKLDDSFYSLSITFFGIFIALLLNVQVAIFGIFQRKWDRPEDDNLAVLQNEKLEERRILLGELNANLSYMVLFSCISLVAFLIFTVFNVMSVLIAAATVAIYIHFVLTLMMAVKRAHTLFQMEYEGHV